MNLTEKDSQDLRKAMVLLENPGIAAKITNFIGSPIEKGIEMLPESWSDKIGDITQTALLKATDIAIFTLNDRPKGEASNWWHKIGATVSGGVGGFFGLPALIVELPISTTIMLRSIADIARAEGESISDLDTKLACLEVFALGGKSKSDNAAESGYFVVRAALAKSVTEAAQFIATKSLAEKSSPALMKLIVKIAERFSIQVTEKIAAQSIPAIGAAGGAIVNAIFISHFQDMAKGHFIVRKLENRYGKECVKLAYEEMLKKENS
ncbi:EcsC family protein [Flavobacterium sp.]|uniref:EcsC family protein n=1 Tax=Flavobacterium sp. TaxID=239 RepID=UPI003C43418F